MENEKTSSKKIWIPGAAVVVIIVILLLVFRPFKGAGSTDLQSPAVDSAAAALPGESGAGADPVPADAPAAEPTELPAEELEEAGPEDSQPAGDESPDDLPPGTAITAANVTLIEEVLAITGHSSEILEIAFSPDSSMLASASADNTVKIWNTADGTLRLTLTGHTDRVLSLAFSPQGDLLLSGSQDGTVKKWQMSDGQLIDTISRANPVRALDLAFSPDGLLFAVANHTGFVELRRTDTGILYKTIVQTDSFGFKEDYVVAWGLSFTPDGEQILVGAGRNQHGSSLRVYDVHSYADSELLIGMNVRIRDLAYAPDGERIAVAFLPLSVFWVVDAEDGSVQQVFEGHSYAVTSLAFSADGLLIVSAGEDQRVYLWDASTGERLGDLSGHAAPVNSVAFSPDGAVIASAAVDGTIRMWRIAGD
jgi:WD40 repeat protein